MADGPEAHTMTSSWLDSAANSTTLTYLATKRPERQYADETNTVRVAYFYSLAVILPLGIICNAVCVGIFISSRSLRRSTTAHYLAAMAMADTLFLIGEMMRWSSLSAHGQPITGHRFMHDSDLACKLTYFLRYSGKVISAWLTVVITAERFITIAFPLTVSRISTQIKARITICVIAAVGFALGSFPLWTVHKGEWRGRNLCQYVSKNEYDTWSTVVLRFGQLLIPSVLIFILTALIIIFLAKASRRRVELFQGNSISRKTTASVRYVERQLTVMLLFVAVAFLLLRLPYCVTYYLTLHKKSVWTDMSEAEAYGLYLSNKIADILATSNYAANFFLYCMSGSIFRQQLRRLVPCLSKKKRTPNRVQSLTRSSLLSTHATSTKV